MHTWANFRIFINGKSVFLVGFGCVLGGGEVACCLRKNRSIMTCESRRSITHLFWFEMVGIEQMQTIFYKALGWPRAAIGHLGPFWGPGS